MAQKFFQGGDGAIKVTFAVPQPGHERPVKFNVDFIITSIQLDDQNQLRISSSKPQLLRAALASYGIKSSIESFGEPVADGQVMPVRVARKGDNEKALTVLRKYGLSGVAEFAEKERIVLPAESSLKPVRAEAVAR